MSSVKEVKIENNRYLFVNETVGTRSGFAHISQLFKNDVLVSSAKCNYLNRTWESYRYATSMRETVDNLIEKRINSIKNNFMTVNMYKKMTEKRKAEFDKVVALDAIVSEYKALYEALRA